MEITAYSDAGIVLQVRHRGTVIDFVSKLIWRNIGKSPEAEAVFTPLNEYFDSLSSKEKDFIFSQYTKAHGLIEAGVPIPELKSGLTDIIGDLINSIDYEHLTNWVYSFGQIAYNKDIRTTYTTEYQIVERLTYLKDEYDELVVLSFLFKMLTPIWGAFLRTYCVIDDAYKEVEALELIRKTYINGLPAMIRFTDYCECLTDKYKKEGLTAAICTRIGTSEMPKYFLAIAVIHRISISEIRDPDRTIIRVTYNYLNSKARGLSFGIRDKRSTKLDQDDKESKAESYRITQTAPDYAIQMASDYIMDTEHFARAVGPDSNVKKALGYVEAIKLNPSFTITSFHYSIVGLVCDRAVHLHTFGLIEREPMIHAIGVTAGWLSDNGFQNLANMLLANRIEKDPEHSDIYDMGGFTFAPITEDNEHVLESMYPYRQKDDRDRLKINPGIALINNIIEEVNNYEWEDINNVSKNLRNDIVELLIIREQQLKAAREKKLAVA